MSFTIEAPGYDLSKTMKCGQIFRFRELGTNDFEVHSKDLLCRVRSHGGTLMVDCDGSDNAYWVHYFNTSQKQGELKALMSGNAVLREAYEFSKGTVLLQQYPFECLVEFIISQQKRIPQIQECLECLCELCGPRLPDGSYGFPEPSSITRGIAPFLKLGYRAPYVINAAEEVSRGFDLEGCRATRVSEDVARANLMRLYGVGRKIADCVMLFSLGFTSAFPVDTHIQKVLDLPEMKGFNPDSCGSYAGLVQQYLYNYALYNGY